MRSCMPIIACERLDYTMEEIMMHDAMECNGMGKMVVWYMSMEINQQYQMYPFHQLHYHHQVMHAHAQQFYIVTLP